MKKLMVIAVFALLFSSNPVTAGSQQHKSAKFSPEQIKTYAKNVENFAAEKGARAFIIARLGQPKKELPKGIKFTHTAIAIYSKITLDNNESVFGYAIYNLYQDNSNPDKSSLVTDYPVDFFWGAEELSAGIIIPTPQLQQRIIESIARGDNVVLHNEKYSLIANPYNNQFQNCTEHTLNIINAAIYQTNNIHQLKVNTKAYFNAQRVNTSRFKLMLGNLFAKGVTTKDHNRTVKTTTFSTIARYLQDNNLLQEAGIFTQSNEYLTL